MSRKPSASRRARPSGPRLPRRKSYARPQLELLEHRLLPDAGPLPPPIPPASLAGTELLRPALGLTASDNQPLIYALTQSAWGSEAAANPKPVPWDVAGPKPVPWDVYWLKPVPWVGVRYFDGTVQLTTTDLASAGFGTPWGQTRSWTNNPGYTGLGWNGSGMVIEQLPYLLQTDTAGNTLVLVTNGTTAHYFDRMGTSSQYQARFYDQDQLAFNLASGEAVVTDPAGDQLHFLGVGYGVPRPIASFVDPAGNTTRVVSLGPDGKVGEVQSSFGGVTESYLYQYLPTGVPNGGLLQNVTLRRSTDGGGTWTTVRQVAYTYYGPGQPYGNLGDLATATLRDGAGRPLDTDYYRYDTADDATGYVHGLKYVFGPQAYARLVAAVGDPTTAIPPPPRTPWSPRMPTTSSSTTASTGSAFWWRPGPGTPAARAPSPSPTRATPSPPGTTPGAPTPRRPSRTAAPTTCTATPTAR
jgi:hypothetical protein